MLEILLVIFLGKKAAAWIKEENGTAWPWVTLVVAGWFGGEIIGAVMGALILFDPKSDEFNFGIYGFAIAGALIGGLGALGLTKVKANSLRSARENGFGPR